MGSKSDWETMRAADDILTQLGVAHEVPGRLGAPHAEMDGGVRLDRRVARPRA